ncbi:MAG: hypothetical protein M3R25_03645 [Bacteroidota bacterium]|nr:hypothetical protein [Bacteroidota bacterium]
MRGLHQQLSEKITELEQIKKIRAHTSALQQRLSDEQQSLSTMEKVLDKEQRDVEALEREGISTMFRKWMGDREEKLDKEREEYLKASLRFNELYKSVELIKFELDLLTKKEQNQDQVQGEIEILFQQREAELINTDPTVAQSLQAIHQQSDKFLKFSVEVDEALKAGTAANEFIIRAANFLIDAKMYGERNLLRGSHGYGGNQKYQSIDRARGMVQEARHALVQFERELRDVDPKFDLNVNFEIESFGQFTNVFFENLITDYFILQKIEKSLLTINQTRQEIEHILRQLHTERTNVTEKIKSLEEERKKIIVNHES